MPPRKGHFVSDKTKRKISETLKGHKASEETRRKMSIAHKGKPLTEQTKRTMSKNRRGINSCHWKGGKFARFGYIFILMPEHPRALTNGYIRRSHLVIEKVLGRHLTPIEVVHHKGVNYPLGSIENKQDDSPENLQLFSSNSSHIKFHWQLKPLNRYKLAL